MTIENLDNKDIDKELVSCLIKTYDLFDIEYKDSFCGELAEELRMILKKLYPKFLLSDISEAIKIGRAGGFATKSVNSYVKINIQTIGAWFKLYNENYKRANHTRKTYSHNKSHTESVYDDKKKDIVMNEILKDYENKRANDYLFNNAFENSSFYDALTYFDKINVSSNRFNEICKNQTNSNPSDKVSLEPSNKVKVKSMILKELIKINRI